jgi:seryl-tRNA synthetase
MLIFGANMIDLALLRDEPERIIALLEKKEPKFDIRNLVRLDAQVRAARLEVEDLRARKNELAKAAQKGITPEIRAESIEVSKLLKDKEVALESVEKDFQVVYLSCPNVPQNDLPEGGKEANKVVEIVGSKPVFDFSVKNHVELGQALGWFDFNAASTMAGSNFAFYKGEAVKLMYALTMLMLKNNMKHGFEPVLPSVLVNAASLEVASNFPKFKDQVYAVPADGLYLTPTAEVNLANLYRNQILSADQLPVRMTAWTSCFRREAGTYGSLERGLIRIHQFEKVELYTICEPDNSEAEQERMLACAKDILNQLGLHYRVSLLAMQDCSFPSAKTYDIEVWLPGQNSYYEVSSVSNCTDFQARRGMIRFKKTPDSKAVLTHTLNGSSLALPRLMVALMEVYQQEDGSIKLPEVLKKEALYV